MRFNSLEAWLTWLEQLHPREIDLGLERIGTVAARLGLTAPATTTAPGTQGGGAAKPSLSGRASAAAAKHRLPGEPLPQAPSTTVSSQTPIMPAVKIVSIAGTNGKGSCVAALEALLIDAGYRVGAFTSPHLLHYCERIRIQGRQVAPEAVCAAFETIDAARGDISLTYFEFGTLAAVELFRLQGVDIMLLEVGLGGRLDAVNLWDADVAVVTSIALDHQDWLGSDRESIGREKAGIFRSGRPAICADADPPASIAEAAQARGAPLLQMGRAFSLGLAEAGRENAWCWRGQTASGDAVSFDSLPVPELPLPSVAAALQACYCLGINLKRERLQRLLSRLTLPGRLQRLSHKGLELILDVAHNPAAAAYLAQRLAALRVREEKPTGAKTYAIVAIMADKDRPSTLAPLLPLVDHWFVAGLPHIARATPVVDLAADLRALGAVAQECATAAAALTQITRQASAGDRVLVFGSFFTVAAALEAVEAAPSG